MSPPRAATGRPAQPDRASVTATRDGSVHPDRQPMEMPALEVRLRARVTGTPGLTVVTHAGQAMTHGRVVERPAAVRSAGVGRLAIATTPKGTPVQP